jgi:hydroxymethylglutaryl-CoA reductase
MESSRLKGFHKLPVEERQKLLAERFDLNEEEVSVLARSGALSLEAADRMIENAIGVIPVPLGLGVNLRIDGRDRLVLMAVEEPSVLAGLSNAAKRLRAGQGIVTETTDPVMIAQIQLLDVPDPQKAEKAILDAKNEIVELADQSDTPLIDAGGGARDLEVRHLEPMGDDDPIGPMVVVHLLVDVRDAMGANAVNTMAEGLAGRLAELSGGRARLRILSNLADRRLVTAKGTVPIDQLSCFGRSGADVAKGIEEASVFAERDPYRAATHNKGVMNGIDAVLLATGQDYRAVEAGAHSYASRIGRYTSLTKWRVRGDELTGEITLPMAVGTVGGVVGVHPTVKLAHKIMEIESASDLARVAASVGLTQNLGAIRALAVEGIQRGHMRLHARNLAVAAGAEPSEVDAVVDWMARQKRVDVTGARDGLAAVRSSAKK